MIPQSLRNVTRKIFGSRNDRLLKRYQQKVVEINALEPQVRQMTDAQLRAKVVEFRERAECGTPATEFLSEILAVAREAMDRYVGIRTIFNPEFEFDSSRLSAEMQQVYTSVLAQCETIEPKPVKGGEPVSAWLQVEVPLELYEAVREMYPESRPPFRARPFDVQLIGGMVLGEGRIAEMRTGEGKTIVAPLACFVACIDGLSCHVVTVNDYLVQRDRDWVFPFYYGLGLTVGAIHPMHMQSPHLKKEAYDCDVLYATNSELGFDYLRDNMKHSAEEQVQKQRDFVIIDEVDSILIDEARTPLIISGPAHAKRPRYELADDVAQHLMQKQQQWDVMDERVLEVKKQAKGLEGDIRNVRDRSQVPVMRQKLKELQTEQHRLEGQRDKNVQYYEVERDRKAVHLTHRGVAEAQKKAAVGSFYVGDNMDFPHLLENALKAHAVYRADREYVVREGEIVIVDENTGRLMVGRQWSDGLHQAVECKEKVKVKDETQTLATVTIQNFFKLYKRLAGMTGTAITESTEFWEIYQLEVVAIPTNRPIRRADREDLIYLSQKDKWNSIMEEIRRAHDIGRPVLVGTTSVEKSEMLATMLERTYGVPHSVLNAKQHEREAHIVENAGALGSVMIATNMAGRGTDIKLRPIPRDVLVSHWIKRGLLPDGANAEMTDEALIEASWRWMAHKQIDLLQDKAQNMELSSLKLKLCRHWVEKYNALEAPRAQTLDLDACFRALDNVAEFKLHRLQLWGTAEQMGGLLVVGTERHESRRIDNQLRGRSGRQGDQGASRFFLALDDDLMKMFAGERTMSILARFGMREGDAIEHSYVSRAVERAQRKVEERNFEIRKNLLEYDEVMEYQRRDFYGTRQRVLEGNDADDLVLEYLADSVDDAADIYLGGDYAQNQVAEWCRDNLRCSVDPGRLDIGDTAGLKSMVLRAAMDESVAQVSVTVGEYVFVDLPESEWDLPALAQWFRERFSVEVLAEDLRGKQPTEINAELVALAKQSVAQLDLSGLEPYLEKDYSLKQFVGWARTRFAIELEDEDMIALKSEVDVATRVLGEAVKAYRRRELSYGLEQALGLFEQDFAQDPQWALDQLRQWTSRRFGLQMDEEAFRERMDGKDIGQELTQLTLEWMAEDGGLRQEARERAAALKGDAEGASRWLAERFDADVSVETLESTEDWENLFVKHGVAFARKDFSVLERQILLQVLDQCWKDHLYAMDQLKDGINLSSFAEKDPRIEYKKKGSVLYKDMQRQVRDVVSEYIMHARMQRAPRKAPVAPPVSEVQSFDGVKAQSSATPDQQPIQQTLPFPPMESMPELPEVSDPSVLRPVTKRQRRARKANLGETPKPSSEG